MPPVIKGVLTLPFRFAVPLPPVTFPNVPQVAVVQATPEIVPLGVSVSPLGSFDTFTVMA